MLTIRRSWKAGLIPAALSVSVLSAASLTGEPQQAPPAGQQQQAGRGQRPRRGVTIDPERAAQLYVSNDPADHPPATTTSATSRTRRGRRPLCRGQPGA